VSRNTVQTRVSHILARLGVHSRAEIVRAALAHPQAATTREARLARDGYRRTSTNGRLAAAALAGEDANAGSERAGRTNPAVPPDTHECGAQDGC
jgi:hypothetical protein